VLSISHSLTGAYLAATLHPAIALPTILASHYLEDWMPHWDVGTGLSAGTRKRSTAIILELGELAITIGLVYLFFQTGKDNWQIWAWIGAVVGILPDFLEAPRNFLKWEPGFIKPINDFHALFHHSTPNILLGLTPQIVLWWIIWYMK
jgi:hypothetical protein